MPKIRIRPNKYRTECTYCKSIVERHAGYIWRQWGRWVGAHIPCYERKAGAVSTITFSSGESYTRNRSGRCEDAPCCGCCTI